MRQISPKRTFPLSSLLIVSACIALGAWVNTIGNSTNQIFDEVQRQLDSPAMSGSYGMVELGDTTIHITSPLLTRDRGMWSYSASASLLPADFVPYELVVSPISYGDTDKPMRVDTRIADPLTELADAAANDGVRLQLSSAYRSIDDQSKLLREITATRGVAYAEQYVATPRASEHHTGLAVDFADASDTCSDDSAACALSQASADWLAENAAEYGFILRYPLGKQPITGVAYEPWHYRYVGVALARALTQADLTYDEFSQDIRTK